MVDDSHDRWWRGSNQRGEGLFPANFVTTDLRQELVANLAHLAASAREKEDQERAENAEAERKKAAEAAEAEARR